jgi:apolipoprotein N-acyltransferase
MARNLYLGRPGRRRPGRFVAAPLLGALLAAGQAPLGFWGLALPALAALIWLIAGTEDGRTATALGWLAGVGYFGAAMFWIVDPFFVDPAQDGWMAPFALVLMAGGMALFWALAGALSALLGADPRGRALGFAVALAASDLLRGYFLTGLPWALVGHIWIGTWPAQAAALVGPVGLSLMTTLAAAAPTAFGAVRGAVFAWALIGAAGGWGLVRLHAPEPAPTALTVRLIQPNAAQHLKWRSDLAPMFFDRLLKHTAAPGKPDLIVWPETSVPFLLNRPGDGLKMVVEAAHGVPVAIGIQRTEGYRAYNSLAILNADGTVGPVYDKHHLVPFGEYIPLGDLIWRLTGIERYAPSQGYGYSSGPGPQVLDLGRLGRVLPLICYEAVFPQDLRTPTRADWILQVTDDGWFGTLSGPYQHFAQVRLRAIEQGLPILRAANTGVSAVIDAKGRVLQRLPLDTEGHIDAIIPGALPATIYSRTGDWPMLLLLLILAAGLFRRRLRQAH